VKPRLLVLAGWFLLGWLLLFFAYPLFRMLRGGFSDESGAFTLSYLTEALRNPIYLEGLWNAFCLATITTLLVFILALPAAFLNARTTYPGKGIVSALLLTPMILPPFVGALGLRQFWGQAGVLNAALAALGLGPEQPIDWLGASRLWGVSIALALHLYPILYLNALAALANLDPSLDEAARNLGAGSWRRFFRITLPLMTPGLFAGGTLVFIWAFTELGTPLMFDYTRITSVQVFDSLKEIGDSPFPYVLVVILFACSVALYLAGRVALGGAQASLSRGLKTAVEKPLAGWGAKVCLGFTLFLILISILPHAGLVFLSFGRDWYATLLPREWTLEHYRHALSHPFTVPSIGNSLRYAGVATILDLVFGLLAAWLLVRTRMRGRVLLDALVMAPLAVPGMVLAFGYLAMTQPGEIFEFLDPARDPTILLIIAYSIRRLPYVVRAAAAGLEQASVTLEEAAHNLGAGAFRTLRKITLPLVSANLIAGGVLAFCFAMLEVSDSLMLAQKQVDFPITKAIYELFQLLGEGRTLAAALGVWSMAFLAAGLIFAAALLGRKMGALFRA
jgi:iron(III) transport system permease protein